ncbi:VanZ family protein [Streptomyces nanshensis]
MQNFLNAAKGKAKPSSAGKTSAQQDKSGAKKAPAQKTAQKSAAKKSAAGKSSGRTAAGAKKSAAKKTTAAKTGAKNAGAKKSTSKSTSAKGPKKQSAAAKRAAALEAALSEQRLPLVWRVLILIVAFVAMVGFAVVLSKLTLNPSAASESLIHSNLRPGDSIRNYLSQPAIQDTLKQLGGNIVLGMPFGVLLPALVPRTRGLLRVMLATALVMLLVELVQGALVQGRAFDIDDVILNTTGAMLGYLILGRRLGRAVHPRRRHWWHRPALSSSRRRS